MSENWNDLKDCIRVSSPEFYKIIESMSYLELQSAETKVQLTARKYYNRAVFRSTPYGLFSSIGVTTMDWNKEGIQLANNHKAHYFPDWSDKPEIYTSIDKMAATGTKFFSNGTFYTVGKEIRYIQKSDGEYQIAAVDYNETIISILQLCCLPKTFRQVIKELKVDESELLEYMEDLLYIQLLFSSLHPNIIGEEYFKRISQPVDGTKQQYIITEGEAIVGQLDQKAFRHLPDLALQMGKVMEMNDAEDLKKFRESFSKKFEQAEISLMLALDPEAGVGYGNMETRLESSPLAAFLEAKGSTEGIIPYNKLQHRLYEAICRSMINGSTIDLEDLVKDTSIQGNLPNSLYALCTLVDGNIFIDSCGGSSAVALSGRFALAIPEINEYCKEVAALEQQSNPDVLLFDVGYTKEDAVDNINRRPSIYDYELNILNYDTSERPLSASDILVSTLGGEVVLRSKSLNKRLVPRFASGYNYKRADLPLFRLLMDIQSQNIQTNLTLRPSSVIPNLPYYPRIQYRNIIVAPATWMIDKALLDGISKIEDKCNCLSDYLRAKLPCNFVKVGSGDQTLFLDIRSKDDVEVLLLLLERSARVYLEEAYLPERPVFTNAVGHPFLAQVVVTLTHTNKIWYGMVTRADQSLKLENKQWISPGGEWLYFEIYGNPFRLNELLDSKVKYFLQGFKRLIRTWFFIRYNENGDHIRLRVKLKDTTKGYIVIAGLTESLKEELHIGSVSDIKLCTYKKEVHRYSAMLMEHVEQHFQKDSHFVVNTLNLILPDFTKYHLCIGILDKVYDSQIIAGIDLDHIIKSVSENLKSEHAIGKEDLRKVNMLYKEFELKAVVAIPKRATALHMKLINSTIKLLAQCPESSRSKLLADLMHMHINRLFVSDQRLHEFVIYDFYNTARLRRKHLSNVIINAVSIPED